MTVAIKLRGFAGQGKTTVPLSIPAIESRSAKFAKLQQTYAQKLRIAGTSTLGTTTVLQATGRSTRINATEELTHAVNLMAKSKRESLQNLISLVLAGAPSETLADVAIDLVTDALDFVSNDLAENDMLGQEVMF